MSRLAINGITKEIEGLRDQALADLQVYTQASVGVGEHGDITAEIKRKLEAIDSYDSLLETINRYVPPQAASDENQSTGD